MYFSPFLYRVINGDKEMRSILNFDIYFGSLNTYMKCDISFWISMYILIFIGYFTHIIQLPFEFSDNEHNRFKSFICFEVPKDKDNFPSDFTLKKYFFTIFIILSNWEHLMKTFQLALSKMHTILTIYVCTFVLINIQCCNLKLQL